MDDIKSKLDSAYSYVRENRILSKRHWEVYHILYGLGRATAGEISLKYKRMTRNHISARLGEMEQSGMVKRVGKKISVISGRPSFIWSITLRRIPKAYRKRKRKFFINIYENKIEGFRTKKEANKKIKSGFKEMIEVNECKIT